MPEQKSHKTQIIVALIGAIAIIIAATIGIAPKLMESSAKPLEEITKPITKNVNNLLSDTDLNDIVGSKGKDAKELSRKYFNKYILLKGSIFGSFRNENYMVVWVETNNIRVGCLSAPDNKKLKALKDGEKATIKGVIHHIEPHSHSSSGNQLVLARGCTIDKNLDEKENNKDINSSATSGVKKPLIPEGTYRQTSVKPISLGECPQCEITIKYRNKNTIEIESNNDWFGYAHYDKDSASYKGTSEYLKGRGGNYKGTKSNIVVFYNKNVISIDSTNEKVSELIKVTYKLK